MAMRSRFTHIVRVCIGVATLASLLTGGSLQAAAHDVFRVVGTIVKWDPVKSVLTITTRETQADGKVIEDTVRLSVHGDTVVTRLFKKVALSELKPGVFVVIDAAGVDNEIDANEIEIVVPTKPATKAQTPAKKP